MKWESVKTWRASEPADGGCLALTVLYCPSAIARSLAGKLDRRTTAPPFCHCPRAPLEEFCNPSRSGAGDRTRSPGFWLDFGWI
ncbi:MAG: hypothetical protein EA001_14445 [Oscillatoriales cyanobacterium]|nr:MAG: hypothetical protein EA001_14445 [Oscillatoriales cyanobacterium]